VPADTDPTDGLTVRVSLLRTWTVGLPGIVRTPPDIAADLAEVLVGARLAMPFPDPGLRSRPAVDG
jgi:hypothetical protein